MRPARAWSVSCCTTAAFLLFARESHAACYGFALPIRNGRYSFYYRAGYTPPSGCSARDVTVSRLYLEGACVGTRDNSFGDDLPDCTNQGGSVRDDSSTTCESIFARGPSGALVNLGDIGTRDVFDSGAVCTVAGTGYIFLQTNCSGADRQRLAWEQRPYGTSLCWDGRTVSRGAVAGVAIACFFALFFIILLLLIFIRRRKQRQPYPQQPPPPPPPPPPYGPYGAPGPSGQNPYAQASPYNPYDKPVTGIPVGRFEHQV